MINLDQLLVRTRGLATAMKGKLRTEVETIAQTVSTAVTTRVSETGKDAEGADFPDYTRPYELQKRGAVSTAKREGKKRRAARRTAEASADKPVGRFTGFRNFTLSGQMLSSIGLTEVQDQSGKIIVRVAGRDEFTQDKMEGNDNVTPGWYKASEEEIKRAAGQSQVRLTKFAQEFMNA